MLAADIPTKFPIPFADAAGGPYIRPIPEASQIGITPGAASLTDGFPPLNFDPVSGGGIPPFGQDFNGLLNQISAWSRWQAAGVASAYDGTFSAAIGGYPKGALVLLTQGQMIVKSHIDNNTTDPNSSLTGWEVVSTLWSETVWVTGGTANALTITLTSAPTSLTQLVNVPLRIYLNSTNTGPTTLNVNGLGARNIFLPNGGNCAAGTLTIGYYHEVIYNGSGFQLVSPVYVTSDPTGAQGFVIDGSAGGTGSLKLIGGTGTPNKWIRSSAGKFAVINSAYTQEIFSVTDAGAAAAAAGLSAGTTVSAGTSIGAGTSITAGTFVTAAAGNVTAGGGRLRATFGAYLSGDANAGVILNDFFNSGGYERLPNGWIIQWGSSAVGCTSSQSEGGLTWFFDGVTVTFPVTFPNAVGSMVATPIDYAGHLAINANIAALSTAGATVVPHATAVVVISFYWIAVGW